MKNIKKALLVLTSLFTLLLLTACTPSESEDTSDLKDIDFILDWVPNTNHTGLYVALEKGYFEEAGLDVTIRRPPEGSGTELVGTGGAQFGIDFQDTIAARFEKGLPVTAVAAIIDHNTSGIVSHPDAEIESAKDLAGKSYGTWNEPIELAIVEHIVTEDGGNFEDVELVPNQADNSVVGLSTKMFDSAWIYYAWDGVMAESMDVETDFFYLTDFAEELDFYSPVIIANNDYIETNPEDTKKMVQAIKKGYQYAMEEPEESANILMKHAPELKEQADFILASQAWISERYAETPENWGHIEEERWNKFYDWLYTNKLIEKDLTEEPFFTNEYLGE